MASNSRRDYRWKKLRLRVLRRDGNTCAYCGDVATEVDHVIPLVRGGSDDAENLVACCRSCNSRKKDQQVGVFLAQSSTPPVFRRNLSPKRDKTVQNGHTRSVKMSDSPFMSDSSSDQSGAN